MQNRHRFIFLSSSKLKTYFQILSYLQEKVVPISLTISHKGEMFAVIGKDKIVRIYDVSTGKIKRKIDESIKVQFSFLGI